MSKLAKKIVPIPAGVAITSDGFLVSVTGPKGKQEVKIPVGVQVTVEAEGVKVSSERTAKQARADVGTTWSLIRNATIGTTAGFQKVLEIEGVGFKMAVEGDTVVLSLGFVNPVRLKIPEGVTATSEKTALVISGMNKEAVGQFAAEIRSQKKPEPYKGKGIRYRGETIRRKVGKKAATAS